MLAKPATRRFSNSMPALLALATIAALAIAGPLSPPAGPVAPTPGPEPRIAINATNTPGDNDSLFKITQPGSYYLTGNIAGVTSKHGIEIVTSGVTLDLNGFDLVGLTGMGAFDGVSVTVSNLSNIKVRNGSVRNWGDEGVDLASSVGPNNTVRDVRAAGNGGDGISVAISSAISGCVAYANVGNGLRALSGSTISRSSSYDNGISGIVVTFACTVTECAAYSNASAGIDASVGSLISGCTSRLNWTDGIVVTAQCFVTGNSCATNGDGGDGAGIRVIGGDNRIDSNHCTGADRGIDVDSPGNIIIKNTCAGNTTNWTIVGGNHYGPIIDRTAVAAPPAVNGNAATEAIGSTHPNANFTY